MAAAALQLASDDGPEWVSPGLPLYLRHKSHRDVVQEDLRGLRFERVKGAGWGSERLRSVPWGRAHREEAKAMGRANGITPVAYLVQMLHAWVAVFMPKGTGLSLTAELIGEVCGASRGHIYRTLHELDGDMALRYANDPHAAKVTREVERGDRRWLRRERQMESLRSLTSRLPAEHRRRTWTDASDNPHVYADIRGVARATLEGVRAIGIRIRTIRGCQHGPQVRQEVSCSSPAWADLCKSMESARKNIERRLLLAMRKKETPSGLSSSRFANLPPHLSSKGGVRGGNHVPSGSDPPAQGEGVPGGDAIGWPLGSHEPLPMDTGVAAVGPIGERGALPPGRENASRANHGNPRALGTNPRASWDNPRWKPKRHAAVRDANGIGRRVLGDCAACGTPAESAAQDGTPYCHTHIPEYVPPGSDEDA